MDIENEAIAKARKSKERYVSFVLKNGDTPKQLLARCRYILAKKKENWISNQMERAELLFTRYIDLQHAYNHTLAFRNIYEDRNKESARKRFTTWMTEIKDLKIIEFNTVADSVEHNLEEILIFFIYRNTNPNAESFNSKIKLFRANERGAVDTKSFLFRLEKLFA